MKKLLYVLPLVALSFQASAHGNIFKSGVRIGVEGGYKHHKTKHSLEFVPEDLFADPPVPETASENSKNDTGLFGVHIAYDCFFNQVYAAIEAIYRYAPGSVDSRIKFLNPSNAAVLTDNIKVSQYHNHDIGFHLHLGHTITDCFLLYGIVGLHIGFFEEKLKTDGDSDLLRGNKRSDTKIGGAFGLGGRYGLPCGWSVSTEATYDVYGKIKSSNNLHIEQAGTEGTRFIQSSDRPRMFNLVFKVSKTL